MGLLGSNSIRFQYSIIRETPFALRNPSPTNRIDYCSNATRLIPAFRGEYGPTPLRLDGIGIFEVRFEVPLSIGILEGLSPVSTD